MDPFAPPAATDDELEPTLGLEVEDSSQEDDSAEPEPQDESPLLARLKALEQRIGTEEDVRTVKSQRDQLRNELEQLKPSIEQLQRAVQETQVRSTRDEDAQFEYSWKQYVDSQPSPEARNAAIREYNFNKAQRDLAKREALIAQREAETNQSYTSAQEQMRAQAIMGFYDEQARTVGVDPAKLDHTSPQKLSDSFRAEFEKAQRLRQNPPPTPGAQPQRQKGTPATQTIDQWFARAAQQNDWRKINEAIKYAEQNKGVPIEDILRR
jgi:hypothetical protein